MKRVSLVVPFYNEDAGIDRFLDNHLIPELEKLTKSYNFEVILVDDGSKDKSVEKVKNSEFFTKKSKIDKHLICFSRNFGKEMALAAGIKHATGDAVIMIDADGQHPVETIPKMIEEWEKGARIVTAVREHSKTKHNLASAMYYKMLKMSGTHTMAAGTMDFRLIDRAVAEEYNRFAEHNRITRGLIDWLGYPQKYIKVKLNNRMSGKATYSHRKLVSLAIDSFTSMSRTPLAIFGYLGVFIAFFSLIIGLFDLIEQYLLGDPMHLEWNGTVALCFFISFLVGLVLISQATTALYVSQIHTEAKNRPLFVIDYEKSINIAKKK